MKQNIIFQWVTRVVTTLTAGRPGHIIANDIQALAKRHSHRQIPLRHAAQAQLISVEEVGYWTQPAATDSHKEK